MKESDLYEALLEIDGRMSINLKNDYSNNKLSPRIEIIPVGDMTEETLKSIMKIVTKYGADIKLGAIGVIVISFKEEEVVEDIA